VTNIKVAERSNFIFYLFQTCFTHTNSNFLLIAELTLLANILLFLSFSCSSVATVLVGLKTRGIFSSARFHVTPLVREPRGVWVYMVGDTAEDLAPNQQRVKCMSMIPSRVSQTTGTAAEEKKNEIIVFRPHRAREKQNSLLHSLGKNKRQSSR